MYAAYFCEENIWHLCRDEGPNHGLEGVPLAQRQVWIITNRIRTALCACQRGGQTKSHGDVVYEGVVIWDYHVVLSSGAQGQVWDFNSMLPMGVAAAAYLSSTFPVRNGRYAPRIAVVPALDYVELFASDRRHMVDEAGQPRQPHPPWPQIRGSRASSSFTLDDLLTEDGHHPGHWFDIDSLSHQPSSP
jgi:protein N-terminal glutamine amidohydrolase